MEHDEQTTSGQPDYRISVRFGDAVLEAGHTSVPNLVLQHYAELSVSPGELVFMLLCLQHKWGRGNPHPSLGSIAGRMGVTRRQVRTYASRLKAKRLLTIEERSDPVRGQLSSLYDFTPFLDAVVRLESDGEIPGKVSSQGGGKFSSQGPRKHSSDQKEEEAQEDFMSSNSSKSPLRSVGSLTRNADVSTATAPRARVGGSASLGEILASRRNAAASVHHGVTSLKTAADYVDATVLDVSNAIQDSADPSSNVARARRMMLASGLDDASFVVCLLRAQALLKERSRNGRRSVRRPGAYFFSILEGILGEIRAKKALRGPTDGQDAAAVHFGRKRASSGILEGFDAVSDDGRLAPASSRRI